MECISPVFIRKIWKMVPCGKCNFCLQSSQRDWIFRLQWEKRVSTTSKFITLTYDNESLPLGENAEPTLVKTDLQKFFKRLRKFDRGSAGRNRKIRYYAIGDYGTEKGRPHYHIILFNAKRKTTDQLHKIWTYGSIDVGDVTGGSIGYVAGYTYSRQDYQGLGQRPYAVMSRRPGIGANYLKSNSKWHKEDHLKQETQRFHVLNDSGRKQRMPRYFKDKVFTTGDKERYNGFIDNHRVEHYLTEVKRLAAHSNDPTGLYEYARHVAHENLGISQLKKQKI